MNFVIGARGLEAINIQIVKRNIDHISKMKKIPKLKQNKHQQMQDLGELFQSTM